MPNVAIERREVTKYKDHWSLVSDCVEGQKTIKERKDKYLPRPNPSDDTEANRARYDAYLLRAVFYNVTGRTLTGLVGQVFSRDVEKTLPDALKVVDIDVDGSGISAEQQAKRALEYILEFGRAGILVDYPKTDGASTTVEQLESGEVRPVIKLYRPEDVINWRTKVVGSRVVLSMVVLRDFVDSGTDEFDVDVETKFRVLRLRDDGTYTQQVFRYEPKNKEDPTPSDGDEIQVLDASGQPFREIPFTFIGASNNDHTLDQPPLYDLAELNVGHYRNSADYEESCFVTGQPTVWASGLTTEWVETQLGGKLSIGARGGIPLPRDAQCGILQCEPNTMPFEAMGKKESQMVALGAKLVENKQVQRTATEATQDEAADSSILGSCSKNVSAAYTNAFWWALAFIEAGALKRRDKERMTTRQREQDANEKATDVEQEIVFDLNADFEFARMTAQEIAAIISAWHADAITYTEMRHNLKRGGYAHLDDAIAKEESEENPAIDPALTRALRQGQLDGLNNEGDEGDEEENEGDE